MSHSVSGTHHRCSPEWAMGVRGTRQQAQQYRDRDSTGTQRHIAEGDGAEDWLKHAGFVTAWTK